MTASQRDWTERELDKMPDVYSYSVGDDAYELDLSSYEAELLSRHGEPDSTVIFAPHHYDEVKRISRAELYCAVVRLAGYLQGQVGRLQYRYGIRTQGMPDGREYTGTGGFGCRFGGKVAIAEAGPGYCQVLAAKVRTSPNDEPGPVLADLRDMVPVMTDDGISLIPTRRRRATDLHVRLQGLARFLDAHGGDTVEQVLSRQRRHRP